MIEKLYYATMAALVIVYPIIIIIEQRKRNKIKDRVVYQLAKRMDARIVSGVLWAVMFVFWVSFLVWQASRVYGRLGSEYFQNLFQLLNAAYLETLRSYFFENEMIRELSSIRFYQSRVLHMLLWIFISGGLAIVWFYRSGQRDAVCDDGIMAGGKLYKWDEIVGYNWGKRYAKKQSGREVWYHDLIIEVKHKRLFSKIFGAELIEETLRTEEGQKEPVDSYLNNVINDKSREQAI